MTERLPTWLRTILNLIIVLMALFGWAVGYWFGKESVKDEVIWLLPLYDTSPTETETPKIKKHRMQDGIRNKGVASAATRATPNHNATTRSYDMAVIDSTRCISADKLDDAHSKLAGAKAIISAFSIFIADSVGSDGEMPVTGGLMAEAMAGVGLLLDGVENDLYAANPVSAEA